MKFFLSFLSTNYMNTHTYLGILTLSFFLRSVRVANELGKGSSKAAKFSIVVTVLTSFSIGLILFLVFLTLREKIAYVFTTSEDVAIAVGDLSPLLAFSLLLNSVQPVLSGMLHNFCYLGLKNLFKTF